MRTSRFKDEQVLQILQEVNPKRVQRVRAKASLRVRKRQRMARRLGPAAPERRKATHPGHVCSCDLVHDQTGSKDVIAIIAEVMAQRGAPWEWAGHAEMYQLK